MSESFFRRRFLQFLSWKRVIEGIILYARYLCAYIPVRPLSLLLILLGPFGLRTLLKPYENARKDAAEHIKQRERETQEKIKESQDGRDERTPVILARQVRVSIFSVCM